MIQFSSQAIEYAGDQLIQTLSLTNTGDAQILFKVRTNNIKAIDARPNTGSIASHGTAKITIKRNENISEGVRLQIMYLECKDPLTKDNFKQLWATYQKNQHSKTFSVVTIGNKQQRKEEDVTSRKDLQRFNSVISNSDSDINLFQSVRVTRNKGLEETNKVEPEPAPKQNKALAQQKTLVQQKLEQQKSKNKILEQKLGQRRNQAAELSETKELQVQKFLTSPSCKKPHFPAITLVVIALIFFGMGYYFGLSGSSPEA